MGGNLFKESKRMESKEEFQNAIQEQRVRFPNLKLIGPRQLKDKETFGDLDMLVETGHAEEIRKVLDAEGLKHSTNGRVLSYLDPNNYQVDLIQIPEDRLMYAWCFFSDGDLGNILGRMVKNVYHLKNSFLGLYYVYRPDDTGNYNQEFLVSLCYEELIILLGLNIQKWQRGFETQDELFEWIYASKYLNTGIFKLENLNNKNRVRDRKRKFYNAWLEFLAGKEPKIPTTNKISVLDVFPGFAEEYDRCHAEYLETKLLKIKE